MVFLCTENHVLIILHVYYILGGYLTLNARQKKQIVRARRETVLRR